MYICLEYNYANKMSLLVQVTLIQFCWKTRMNETCQWQCVVLHKTEFLHFTWMLAVATINTSQLLEWELWYKYGMCKTSWQNPSCWTVCRPERKPWWTGWTLGRTPPSRCPLRSSRPSLLPKRATQCHLQRNYCPDPRASLAVPFQLIVVVFSFVCFFERETDFRMCAKYLACKHSPWEFLLATVWMSPLRLCQICLPNNDLKMEWWKNFTQLDEYNGQVSQEQEYTSSIRNWEMYSSNCFSGEPECPDVSMALPKNRTYSLKEACTRHILPIQPPAFT